MVIRASSNSDFRYAQIRQGQRWLPLVALMLLPLHASAALDAPAPLAVTRQQPRYEVQDEAATRFIGSREEGDDLTERYRQPQEGLAVMLAQAQTVADEQATSSPKRTTQAETGASNRGVVQLLNQVEALNGELNRLRGQIEVLANDVNNAQKRQRDMYVDLDTRLRRIEQGGAANKKDQDALSALEERVRKLEQGSATTATIPQPVVGAAAVPVNPPPPAVAAAPTVAATAPSTTAANPAAAATPPSSSSLPPASLSATDQASIQRAYDGAYSSYRLGDYAGALRGFDSFMKSYPKNPLAANAQYWIGEAYARQGKFREAIEAEHRLLGTYPESAKASDALLIIGTAESNLGDNSAARKTFEELIDKHPGSDAADKAKSRLAKLK